MSKAWFWWQRTQPMPQKVSTFIPIYPNVQPVARNLNGCED
jgi:hypothetical protein